jgi:DNA replication protein DnaC
MRHDPASGAIIIMLRSLKMHGMAQAVTDLMEQGAPAFDDAAVPMLAQLLKVEVAEREVRSIAYHMKAARFPAYKDLSGFDFAASEINEATVRQLHRGEFMDGAQNVVLIGGPGTGKTQVSIAMPGLMPRGRQGSMGFDDVIVDRVIVSARTRPVRAQRP